MLLIITVSLLHSASGKSKIRISKYMHFFVYFKQMERDN